MVAQSAARVKDGYPVAWVRYDDGLTKEFPLDRLRPVDFRNSVPWRQVRSRHGQAHCAPYLKNLARNWGLPIRRHSDFSGIGHLNLPAPPSPAMRAVTMRTGALGQLELITQISGYASIAAAARAIYGGRGGVLQQMLHKIETVAGFAIIDRSSTPLVSTQAGSEFIREAFQVPEQARRQAAPDTPGRGRRDEP
jgi:hypothetical protein